MHSPEAKSRWRSDRLARLTSLAPSYPWQPSFLAAGSTVPSRNWLIVLFVPIFVTPVVALVASPSLPVMVKWSHGVRRITRPASHPTRVSYS